MIATSPEPPMRLTILSAAAAAAAMLSVAAVVTGMSLSTPESKPTTGIFASLNFCSSGIAALLSRAAKPSAEGFLLYAVCSISSCLSTCDSFSGPSNVIVTLYCAAAFSAPCFTACQNWCWKPFEIIATYGFPALAVGLPPPVDGWGAQAADTRRSATPSAAHHRVDPLPIKRRPMVLLPPFDLDRDAMHGTPC